MVLVFIAPARDRPLVFALNHLDLNRKNAFAAKLRGLDGGKTYLVEEITQTPDASFYTARAAPSSVRS